MTPYVSMDEFKATLSMVGESFADADIALALASASEAVDDLCARTFHQGDPGEERLYRPGRAGVVYVDDLVEVASVATVGPGGSVDPWAAGAYELNPLNAAAQGRPFTELRHNRAPGTTIKVTGTFGWPEVPAKVRQATSLLASRFLKRAREAPFGVAGMGAEGFAVRISSHDPDVALLLRSYGKPLRLV